MNPKISIMRALPIVENKTNHVTAWEVRVHVAIENAEGFDDYTVSVSSRKPVADWTASDLVQCLKTEIARGMILKLIALVRYRQEYRVQEDFSLDQLKGFTHGHIPSTVLSLE